MLIVTLAVSNFSNQIPKFSRKNWEQRSVGIVFWCRKLEIKQDKMSIDAILWSKWHGLSFMRQFTAIVGKGSNIRQYMNPWQIEQKLPEALNLFLTLTPYPFTFSMMPEMLLHLKKCMDAALVYLTQYNDKVAIVVANFALLTDLYININ